MTLTIIVSLLSCQLLLSFSQAQVLSSCLPLPQPSFSYPTKFKYPRPRHYSFTRSKSIPFIQFINFCDFFHFFDSFVSSLNVIITHIKIMVSFCLGSCLSLRFSGCSHCIAAVENATCVPPLRVINISNGSLLLSKIRSEEKVLQKFSKSF